MGEHLTGTARDGVGDARLDKLASAVTGFTSSGVGRKVALSRAIEQVKQQRLTVTALVGYGDARPSTEG